MESAFENHRLALALLLSALKMRASQEPKTDALAPQALTALLIRYDREYSQIQPAARHLADEEITCGMGTAAETVAVVVGLGGAVLVVLLVHPAVFAEKASALK